MYKESEGIPWPPTGDDIELSIENILPEALIRFLSLLTVWCKSNASEMREFRSLFPQLFDKKSHESSREISQRIE